MSKKTDFNKLQKKWYDKLKAKGFEDIEDGEDKLKVWSSIFTSKISMESWQAKATYYQMATNFLEEYKFESETNKFIWTKHSEGVSVRDITIFLNKKKSTRTNRTYVWKIIKTLKHTMYQMYMSNQKEYHE